MAGCFVKVAQQVPVPAQVWVQPVAGFASLRVDGLVQLQAERQELLPGVHNSAVVLLVVAQVEAALTAQVACKQPVPAQVLTGRWYGSDRYRRARPADHRSCRLRLSQCGVFLPARRHRQPWRMPA